MPAPRTPPFADEIVDKLDEVLVAVQNLEAQVAAQAEDLDRMANFSRLMYESMYGADPNSSGIWDGTDRYPEV